MREGVPINGRVLAELRYLAGMEQIDLANASCVHTPGCKVAPNKISDYEREVVKPSAANLNAILKALKHALEARGLQLGPRELRALYRTRTLDASNGTGEEDEAKRGDFLRTTAAGLVGAASLESLVRIVAHIGRTDRVDAKLVTAHEDVADSLAIMHLVARPDVLVRPVVHQADTLLGLLDRECSQADRRRLQAATVGSCAQAGLLAFWAGSRTGARHYFAVAEAVGHESGDEALRGQAMAAGSILHSPTPTGGRSGDTRLARDLLQEATNRLMAVAPDIGAWACRWLGQELAAGGDERGFQQAMETAHHLAGQPVHHDGRGFFRRYAADLNRGSPVRDEGVGYVLLGRADRAVDALSAVQVKGIPRRQVTVLTEIAAAHVLQGEPEQACAELARALDLAVDAGFRMGIERIRGVRARFPATWAGLQRVQELDERLRLTHAIS